MATRPERAGPHKSKEVTWSEKDLAKHILRDKKRAAGPDPSPKSSPKVGQRKQTGTKSSSSSGKSSSSSALRSTAPAVGRASSTAREREKLSSTVAAANGGGSHRSGRGEKERRREGGRVSGGAERGRRDAAPSLPREKEAKSSSSGGGGRGREEGRKRGGRESESKRRGERERQVEKRGERGRESGKKEKGLEAASSSSLRGGKSEASVAEKERKPPAGAIPQPMKEVREGEDKEVVEEVEFEYNDDDFEDGDYNEDGFEEDIEEESESESGADDVIVRSPLTTNSDPFPHPCINLVEIMQAIDEENREVSGGQREEEGGPNSANIPRSPPDQQSKPSGVPMSSSQGSLGSQRSQTRRKFVDFSSTVKNEERERVARVTKKRGRDLLSMIELDVVTIDLFDLQPLSEYELYMRSFGSDGTHQTGCQTGGEGADSAVQTDEVETRERWTQCPPEDSRGYGGPSDEEEEDEVAMDKGGNSAVRLASFLKRASQVMAVLLEENAAPSGQSSFHSNQSQIPFCTSRSQINLPEQLQGCTLTSVEYCPTHPHLVMTTHTPAAVCHDGGGGVVCVWNTREPSQPQFLLVSQSPSGCGCFSHLKAPLIFSGNEDGTLVVWDLREDVAMHTRPPGAVTPTQGNLIPRLPTFSTAALPHQHNHHSPILSLTPITTSSPLLHSPHTLTNNTETETIGLSFQLATLDRSGLVIIWVAVETKPHPQGSESDLGLAPNGRVKLVWSTAVDTLKSLSLGSIPVQTLCLRFHPADSNHMFLGTDEGTIVHQTRYGHRPIPRQYQSQTGNPCPCDITSLSFSPWQPDYFLTSCSNGNIALYHAKKAKPLVTWSESTNGIAVKQVEWAWHRPGVFIALDSNSTLYHWNLLENDSEAVQLHTRREGTPAVLSFHLSPSPSPSSPSLALCLSDSTLELHQLAGATPTSSDEGQANDELLANFTNYLQTL